MWKEYTRKEYAEEVSEKKGLFVIVSVFVLFFVFLFWFLDNEVDFFVFLKSNVRFNWSCSFPMAFHSVVLS